MQGVQDIDAFARSLWGYYPDNSYLDLTSTSKLPADDGDPSAIDAVPAGYQDAATSLADLTTEVIRYSLTASPVLHCVTVGVKIYRLLKVIASAL